MDPRERPNINEVVSRLQEIAVARNVNLKAPLTISEVVPDACKFSDAGLIVFARVANVFRISLQADLIKHP